MLDRKQLFAVQPRFGVGTGTVQRIKGTSKNSDLREFVRI